MVFPVLQHIRCRLDQTDLLHNLLTTALPNGLQQLSVAYCRCRHPHPFVPIDDCHGVLYSKASCKLPELLKCTAQLAPSLQHLQIAGHGFYLRRAPSCGIFQHFSSWVGQLTNLRSLKLPEVADSGNSQHLLCALSRALAPLTQLTLLRFAWDGLDVMAQPQHGLKFPTALRDLSVLGGKCEDLPESQPGIAGWLLACQQLTRLELLGALPCIDFEALAGLPQLQDLTCSYYLEEQIYSSQLQPLSACCCLTSLTVDSLVIQHPHPNHHPHHGYQHQQQQHMLWSLVIGNLETGASAAGSLGRPPLLSLRRLSVGNIGMCEFLSPVSTLAPNLTELQDTWCEELTKWPVEGRGADTVDALAGLEQLQVLDTDFYCIHRHLKHKKGLTSLCCLRELRFEVVGQLNGVVETDGLPVLPHLTQLVLYSKEDMTADWAETYNAREDRLIWQNQFQLQKITIKGSSLIGGFLQYDDILMALSSKLPLLQSICLQDCPDLSVVQVAKLVGARAAACIEVRGCAAVTDRDCLVMELSAGGAVRVHCLP